MGMYDDLICEMPLPKTEIMPPKGTQFQTKDTPDQFLTMYTITSEGRLVWKPYKIETVPEEERPYPNAVGIKKMFGSIKRIESDVEEELSDFHKDLIFYTHIRDKDKNYWWEYKARFTSGKCEKIELLDFEVSPAQNYQKKS